MRFVVIGASAAGVNAIKKLRELDKYAKITLISKDTEIYSRCILYHYLKKIRTLRELSFVKASFIEDNKVNWIKGKKVVKIETGNNKLFLDDNTEIEYDKLLIASGSKSFIPPIPGFRECKNVIGFRDFSDVLEIEKYISPGKNIVVLGGGLVGIDAIAGLLPYDLNISLIELGPRILPLQLDEYTANVYQKEFEKKGVKQFYGIKLESVISEDGIAKKVILSDGRELLCDLIICAAGVRANIDFLKDSDVICDEKGLVFDIHGKTNIENIYGAGDVSGRNPIWPVAVKEGVIAASNMCGIKMSMDDFFASKATMNFLNIPTLSLGKVENLDDSYSIVKQIDKNGNYKKIVHKGGKIVGAIIQGDLSYAGVLTQLIRLQIDISKINKDIFDINYSDFFEQTDNFEYSYEKVINEC